MSGSNELQILAQMHQQQQPRQPRFIDRINNPQNYGYIDNNNGSISTHRMATASADGGHYAFPTIVQDPETGELREFADADWREALRMNMKNGNVKQFDTEAEALHYSKNYKTEDFGRYYQNNPDVQAIKQKYSNGNIQ
jgi:hypothetical protein